MGYETLLSVRVNLFMLHFSHVKRFSEKNPSSILDGITLHFYTFILQEIKKQEVLPPPPPPKKVFIYPNKITGAFVTIRLNLKKVCLID